MATPEDKLSKPALKNEMQMMVTKPLDCNKVLNVKPKLKDFQFLPATRSRKSFKKPPERILKLSLKSTMANKNMHTPVQIVRKPAFFIKKYIAPQAKTTEVKTVIRRWVRV